ncbi:MAG: pyruvate flavodoxin/ferredoxin oxidoreductase [Desulfobacterales bacterium]|uniref:Pyruvate flavodoxin/ferredoxin oxidoreductase n=1 Tax=Candidatus Desulfatibia profunda TaxID=2841695 RepID=A0A8J6NTA0_9BACT|nr:pyruvate flavodoxin/ferredoxin oxidoreductase [Candidatus Desulfatibia profunda]MBL7179160.1 pyruvate flavodoxin/ferredoxin oxidoreductase [Desulfobacterales bacterium]
MAFSLMDGNEAIAWGAVYAGCRFFAGYPITPATTIFNAMLKLLPPSGGICLQGEDEIASIGYCLGASMAGMKAMTATSGPGISLCSEQISFAVGSEIPIVIVDVQRLGPSTGSATRGADGDIHFLRWGNSGGLPVIVLAPVDVQDCFLLTIQAFNLAEEFRCPVLIASNKEIAMTRESIDIDAISTPDIIKRTAPPPGVPFLPFGVPSGRLVPYFLPIGATTLVRQTSSTHGPDGYITTDPQKISNMLQRLKTKLVSTVSRFSFHDQYLENDADTLILTYGVTARAALEVIREQKAQGNPLSLLILKTLWPVPEDLIRKKAAEFKRIVVVEMNLGQYVGEIERILPDKEVVFFGQMDGRLISPRQIREVAIRA